MCRYPRTSVSRCFSATRSSLYFHQNGAFIGTNGLYIYVCIYIVMGVLNQLTYGVLSTSCHHKHGFMYSEHVKLCCYDLSSVMCVVIG